MIFNSVLCGFVQQLLYIKKCVYSPAWLSPTMGQGMAPPEAVCPPLKF